MHMHGGGGGGDLGESLQWEQHVHGHKRPPKLVSIVGTHVFRHVTLQGSEDRLREKGRTSYC